MTCREKLQIEHPECIGEKYIAGCFDCPHNYGYLPEPAYCPLLPDDRSCTECWDREIVLPTPDIYPTNNKENHKMTCREKLQIEHPECINDSCFGGCIDCPHTYGYLPKPDQCVCSEESCSKCWSQEIDLPTPKISPIYSGRQPWGIGEDPRISKMNSPDPDADSPHILDSGTRRKFETGAVRDIQVGKGRCDLMPLDVIRCIMFDDILPMIEEFKKDDNVEHLEEALYYFSNIFGDTETMFLELSKHFEEGAKKYGENNWQKGIPTHCYIDSAVRHYLKHKRGDTDERHDRAFVWNLVCCIWTVRNKPELDDYAHKTLA